MTQTWYHLNFSGQSRDIRQIGPKMKSFGNTGYSWEQKSFRWMFFFVFAVSWMFLPINGYGQDQLKQALTSLQSKVGEVQVDKVTYKQTLDILDEAKGKVRFTSVAVDDKGKSVTDSYEFYVSDVDKNTLIRKTSGKKLMVSMWIVNKQKFMKHLKDNQLDNYTDNLEILVSGSDQAQEMIDLFKTAIPLVKNNENKWTSAAGALNWLQSNVGEAEVRSGKASQVFSFSDPANYLVSLEIKKTDAKGTVTSEKYDFNLLDVNKNGIALKVSGTELAVHLEIRGNEKLMMYSKNNILQNYTSDADIYSDDIDQARKIISALNAAIDQSKAVLPSFQALQPALDFLKQGITDNTTDTKTIAQKMDFETGRGTKTILTTGESDSKGKTVNSVYTFYLSDIDPNSVIFKVTGKKVLLGAAINNKNKLVKYTRDGVTQNYQQDVEILCKDVESARGLVEVLRSAIKNSAVSPLNWKSIAGAMDFMKSKITGGTTGTDQYQLGFAGEPSDPFQSQYTETHTDAKGVAVEQGFLFYPFMLEANAVKIESAGKLLKVVVTVKDNQSFIKKLKGGESQGFKNELEILAFDAMQAHDLADALRYIITACKPAEKDWSNKLTCMNFVKETVGNFSNSGKEVKQKVELVNDDPCKISFTVTTTDNKGKTTDEIFEFSLSDMNKLMVNYKIQSNNVYVTLECKNREKFVKVYKNGVQQSYASGVEILEDDVNTARNIADAFRNAIIQCEK